MGHFKRMATRISDAEFLRKTLKATEVKELDAENIVLSTQDSECESPCHDCHYKCTRCPHITCGI